jgi:DNA modification methylase
MIPEAHARSHSDFHQWTGARDLATIGSNSGSVAIPFQSWRSFKEAFAPELTYRAIAETGEVSRVVDPFGGSGTTALAAQFLGAMPTTIEVNPFLADLIEAKLAIYDLDLVVKEFSRVMQQAKGQHVAPKRFFAGAPATFLEPGVNGRYLFSREVAGRFLAFREAIDTISDPDVARLMRVLLASAAVPVSNAVVSGKGRRYRKNWQSRPIPPGAVDHHFERGVLGALFDLRRFASRKCRDYSLLRGDSRRLLSNLGETDLAVFSPPYPNSFDYTDVYNIELWALGYLGNSADNRSLREATLRSHVQILRDMDAPETGNAVLDGTMKALDCVRDTLWNKRIPNMVGAYFVDMFAILAELHRMLRNDGRVYMVVGDSRYGGVDVPVGEILTGQASDLGYKVVSSEPFRSMRASPQQGGRQELAESLIVFQR